MCVCVLRRTHAVEVVEDLVHSYDFIVQLIVAVGGGQEGVAIGDEHVEQIDHLQGGEGGPQRHNNATRAEEEKSSAPVHHPSMCRDCGLPLTRSAR